jgi:hypothetical protein
MRKMRRREKDEKQGERNKERQREKTSRERKGERGVLIFPRAHTFTFFFDHSVHTQHA